MESHDGSNQTLSPNRHPTARSPVSAGHKRITDTLPTVNPGLRAPLPPAAAALARRPPARDPRAGGSTRPAMPSVPLLDECKSNEQRQNRRENKNQAQAFLVRADFIAATRPPVARPAGCTAAPGARPPPPQLVTVRPGRAESSPAPEAEGAALTPHFCQRPGPRAAPLSLLHRGRRGPRDAERREATAARS